MKITTLEPIHETQAIQTGMPLIEALERKKLNVLKSCGGHGLCATCHVYVRQGMESLSPMTERERRTLSFITGTDATSRLACQARVLGNTAVVHLPKGMYIEKAEDLLDLLGTRAPENILHPLRGHVLVAKGKIITRTQIEELKHLREEVAKARQMETTGNSPSIKDRAAPSVPPPLNPPATAAHRPPEIVPPGLVLPKAVPPPRPTSPPSFDTKPPLPASAAFERSTASTHLTGLPTVATGSSLLPRGEARTGEALTEPKIGQTLGRCLLQAKLGAGSTGVVFRALHRTLGIAVAVKVLRLPVDADEATQAAIRERLRTEAQLLAQINHPNIVRVWDFDDEHVFPYVVLELVDGPSLADLIRQSGRITAERALVIGVQVAEALRAANELGVVHRDVKPGNILITRDGEAKLADLGLARSRDGGTSTAGTIAYMPPEQANGGEIDPRSDMYALGATLFHVVSGRLPFPGKSLQEVLYKHAHEPLDPLDQLVPGLPPGFAELIGEMMAKHPDDRPPTYGHLIAQMKALLATLANPTAMFPA